MYGREFAATARMHFPELPVILTTGHAGDLSGGPKPPDIIFVKRPPVAVNSKPLLLLLPPEAELHSTHWLLHRLPTVGRC
jgi:hypothetical protein